MKKIVVTLSILCFISGVSLAQTEIGTPTDKNVNFEKELKKDETKIVATEDMKKDKEKNYYTFRFGKVRMKDTYNRPSISKEIKNILLIRFLTPPRDVDEEYPFYPIDKEWFRNHFDVHVGISMDGKPGYLLYRRKH
jgi:hypothetical protein